MSCDENNPMAFHFAASVIDRKVMHEMIARVNNFHYFMTLTQLRTTQLINMKCSLSKTQTLIFQRNSCNTDTSDYKYRIYFVHRSMTNSYSHAVLVAIYSIIPCYKWRAASARYISLSTIKRDNSDVMHSL